MRVPALAAALLGLVTTVRAQAPPPPTTCAVDPDRRELAVRCSDGKRWTVKSAGLILPPVLRCSKTQQECCETGFRTLREIQLQDLLRFARGQAPVCHMIAGDILQSPPPRPDLQALPEIDDLSPDPGVAPCPRGQHRARGRCQDLRALALAAQAPAVPDPNRVLVPEAAEIVDRLRQEFDASGRCPRDALDIGVVMRIHLAAQARSELLQGAVLDVSPLLARPRDPDGAAADPDLPVACGYNATYAQWQQTSFHCRDERLCFDQSHRDLPHVCVGFARQGPEPFFHQVLNCRNVPACHASVRGQCTGVARLIALGQGVFLRVLLGLDGQPYYFGLLFSPQRPEAARTRGKAQEARALLREVLEGIQDPKERERLRRMLGPVLAPR